MLQRFLDLLKYGYNTTANRHEINFHMKDDNVTNDCN